MSTITQVREDHAKFDLQINDGMPEIFVDGLSQMLLGYPISKLTFHSVVAPAHEGNEIEQRLGVVRIAIPTPVLLEFCRNVLFNAQTSADALSDAGKQIEAQVRRMMDGINIPPLSK